MIKVGGEVDAFCTRCELMLAHTIHALLAGRPVKVECNTCHAVHRYRNPPGTSAARPSGTRARAGATPRERAEVTGFDELLAARNVAATQPYSPKKRFAVGDVVDHSVFGRGFVSALKDGDKLEITFRSDVKVLVHGRS
jgi:hypothetical protein